MFCQRPPAWNFILKNFQYRCFPVNFDKFFRTFFLWNNFSGCLCRKTIRNPNNEWTETYLRWSQASTMVLLCENSEGARHPYFSQSLVFCNHFEELQTMLFEVELIINNTPLTYVYPNTIETQLFVIWQTASIIF